VVVRGSGAGFAQEVAVGPHRMAADEPVSVGVGVIVPYDLFPATITASRVLRELSMKNVQNLSGRLLRVLLSFGATNLPFEAKWKPIPSSESLPTH
jgi:hypothetical protein